MRGTLAGLPRRLRSSRRREEFLRGAGKMKRSRPICVLEGAERRHAGSLNVDFTK